MFVHKSHRMLAFVLLHVTLSAASVQQVGQSLPEHVVALVDLPSIDGSGGFIVADLGAGPERVSTNTSAPARALADDEGEAGVPESWEVDVVTSIMTIAMLLVAMSFEYLFELAEHEAHHSYVFGRSILSAEEKASMHSADVFGDPLLWQLLNRMGSEFMCLGFLALVVWLTNQFGLYYHLASTDSILFFQVKTMDDANEYLHLAEAVHIQLFIGMVFFYVLCFRVASGTVEYTHDLERIRKLVVKQLKEGFLKDRGGSRYNTQATFGRSMTQALVASGTKFWQAQQNGEEGNEEAAKAEIDDFLFKRDYFIDQCVPLVLKWRETQPHRFKELLATMGINNQDVKKEDLIEAFRGCFGFAPYLALSTTSVAVEMMNIKPSTMLSIIIANLIFLFYCYLFELTRNIPMDIICLMVFLALCGVIYWNVKTEQFIKNSESEKIVKWTPCGIDLAFYEVRALQALLFFVCYSFAALFIPVVANLSTNTWWGSLLHCLTYFFAAVVIGWHLPHFAVLTSMPPYFAKKEEQRVLKVMHSFGAGSAQLWAPVTDERNLLMVVEHAKPGIMESVREMVTVFAHQARLEYDIDYDTRILPGKNTAREAEYMVEELCSLMTSWNTKAPAADGDRSERAAYRVQKVRRVLQKEITQINFKNFDFHGHGDHGDHDGHGHDHGHGESHEDPDKKQGNNVKKEDSDLSALNGFQSSVATQKYRIGDINDDGASVASGAVKFRPGSSWQDVELARNLLDGQDRQEVKDL